MNFIHTNETLIDDLYTLLKKYKATYIFDEILFYQTVNNTVPFDHIIKEYFGVSMLIQIYTESFMNLMKKNNILVGISDNTYSCTNNMHYIFDKLLCTWTINKKINNWKYCSSAPMYELIEANVSHFDFMTNQK